MNPLLIKRIKKMDAPVAFGKIDLNHKFYWVRKPCARVWITLI
jgi:hypothetical protein